MTNDQKQEKKEKIVEVNIFRKNIFHPSKLHPVKYIQSHALQNYWRATLKFFQLTKIIPMFFTFFTIYLRYTDKELYPT